MKEILKDKFLLGVVIIFMSSIYLIAGIQAHIETKNEYKYNEISYVSK